jgi:short-subunit dehydrogenase
MNQRKHAMFFIKYGPWAMVVGASKGIGAAFACALASRGLNLVLIARNKKDLTAFAKQVRETYKVQVLPRVMDLSRETGAEALAREITRRETGLLIYNAAASPGGEFLSMGVRDHLKVLSTNCRGPLLSVIAAAQLMKKRGRGGIILMSSLSGIQGGPYLAHYAASKAYTAILAEGLWYELKPFKVDVLACLAGATDTPGYRGSLVDGKPRPGVPVMKPEKVARIALAALGKKPSVVTGRMNRFFSFILTRFMTRKARVRIMASAVKTK